jgi:putative flavoprotein involved in K+ transport
VPAPPVLTLDLSRGEISSIVWASGFRPDYSWLEVDVLDAKGMVRHDGGVVADSPGMYLIGTPFLRRRKSSFIDGACDDAQDLIGELTAYLDGEAGGRRIMLPSSPAEVPAPRPAPDRPAPEPIALGE